MIERALAGFVLAGAIAFVARTVRALSTGGAVAALLVGTAAAIAGWPWATVLIVFFVTSSALSRFKHATREARIGRIVEKGNERDAVQVLANGGVFAAGALLATGTGESAWDRLANARRTCSRGGARGRHKPPLSAPSTHCLTCTIHEIHLQFGKKEYELGWR